MSAKQDRHGVRTVTDLERKYNFGQSFAEVYGLVSDVQKVAEDVKGAVDELDASLDSEEIFNRLTGYGTQQGIYRGDDGNIYVNASYIKGGTISADLIDADNLEVNAANVKGKLTATQIDSSQLTVKAANITGAIEASVLLGEYIYLDSDEGYTAGTISVTGARTSNFAVDITSYGSMRMEAGYGTFYLSNTWYGTSNWMALDGEDIVVACGALYPSGAQPDLGTSTRLWAAVYSATDTIQPSDRNLKNSIEELPDKYLDMFDSIMPVRFKLNDGTSGRYHVGFIAQEVEDAMIAAGIDSKEFGGFIKDKDSDGNDIYMLRYGEFIGVLAAQIKQLEERISTLGGEACG